MNNYFKLINNKTKRSKIILCSLFVILAHIFSEISCVNAANDYDLVSKDQSIDLREKFITKSSNSTILLNETVKLECIVNRSPNSIVKPFCFVITKLIFISIALFLKGYLESMRRCELS
jgi:hypothetical protein